MGWAAVVPGTGRLVVADPYETKIDKYIRAQRKKGIKLIKRHMDWNVPSKKRLKHLKEMYGEDKVDNLGRILR